MTKFLIRCEPEIDVDFLNETDIEISFPDNIGENDSGWCDAETGARILCTGERIVLEPVNEEQEAFIKLRFGSRIEEFRGVAQSGSALGS